MSKLGGIIGELEDMQHKCGVLAMIGIGGTIPLSYRALTHIQHRGQGSAGISFKENNLNNLKEPYKLNVIKDMGLVNDLFKKPELMELGNYKTIDTLVGHVRYSTVGGNIIENAQPISADLKIDGEEYSVSLAHNGQINNVEGVNGLKERLKQEGINYTYQTNSDSEILFPLLKKHKNNNLEDAVAASLKELKGSYCFSLHFLNKKTGEETIIGARDPHGYRPLVLGKKGNGWVISSETSPFGSLGIEYIRDILPGEMISINKEENPKFRQFAETKWRFCDFEYIYFSRDDSSIQLSGNKIPRQTIYSIRKNLGAELYREINKKNISFKPDIVVPLMDSGIASANGFSQASGITLENAILRNKYLPRTFIMPEELRQQSVIDKHIPISDVLYGREVLIIDDSIVTGNTTKQRVAAIKEAVGEHGKVYVAIASPPIIDKCDYGVDTKRRELIARKMLHKLGYTPDHYMKSKGVRDQVIEEIQKYIGADKLFFLSKDGMRNAFPKNIDYCGYCLQGGFG